MLPLPSTAVAADDAPARSTCQSSWPSLSSATTTRPGDGDGMGEAPPKSTVPSSCATTMAPSPDAANPLT